MSLLRLNRAAHEALRQHGQAGYPHESCGILLGHRNNISLNVLEARACANANTERAADRYLLDPQDQLRIEKEARSRGLEVLGYYHSHPDHPSQASATDLAQSWEGVVYLIQAVEKGQAARLQAWWRDPGAPEFRELDLEIV